ncbi:hypothetical protein Trco_006473 [Trichoderma cornu-damae]|uniref:Uncharacterized protein n=1 Tax=Trichoderma cornu-damae TaxID=654480 RepID=A0A9P8QF92_9HYPO|nr:hypothetical protein Trco_006473 [Trichoderma cornu-damae]
MPSALLSGSNISSSSLEASESDSVSPRIVFSVDSVKGCRGIRPEPSAGGFEAVYGCCFLFVAVSSVAIWKAPLFRERRYRSIFSDAETLEIGAPLSGRWPDGTWVAVVSDAGTCTSTLLAAPSSSVELLFVRDIFTAFDVLILAGKILSCERDSRVNDEGAFPCIVGRAMFHAPPWSTVSCSVRVGS